ncbi:MAG TPA: iron ABC transporter permease [Patescibacteria group bacterium]|nr:iron ABC transporter permease [Patescibacteria group bacterium]
MWGLSVLLVIVFLFSFSAGRYPVSPGQVFWVLADRLLALDLGLPGALTTVVLEVRFPRILAAALAGAALAGAGAAYQGMFKNPLVSPDILGATMGAGFGAALAINCSASLMGIQLAAFAGGLTAVFLAYKISRMIRRESILVMVLGGIIIGTCFSAGIYLIKYLADPYDKMPAITFWLMGSLASVTGREAMLMAVPVAVGFVPLLLLRWRLNVLSLDDEEAQALGLNTSRMRPVVIACATLMTAAAVGTCGMIGWVGLVIPHMARFLVGHDYQVLLPASFLLGSIYLLLVDCLARVLFSVEIPLGVLTALLGAPFMVYLMMRLRGGWI